MKQVVICADDFGLNTSTSLAILHLVNQQRISAVSCMTNQSAFKETFLELQNYSFDIDIGLHLNFVYRSLPLFYLKSRLGCVSKDDILSLFRAQLDQFCDHYGMWPDFLDGHEHIHVFPVVREALLLLHSLIPKEKKCYIRLPQSILSKPMISIQNLKKTIINRLGVSHLQNDLNLKGIYYNKSFSGVYPFQNGGRSYRSYFTSFLDEVDSGGLIMCHPSVQADDMTDPISKNRFLEYTYMMSDAFLQDCQSKAIAIKRFYHVL